MDGPAARAHRVRRRFPLAAEPQSGALAGWKLEHRELAAARESAASIDCGRPADDGRASGPLEPPRGRVAARLTRLDVSGGRIKFKLGAEKLPFALVDVTGNLEQDTSGRWSIDLEADPMRAPIPLQNAGTLRLQGTVAGTSARLRPATFALTWQDLHWRMRCASRMEPTMACEERSPHKSPRPSPTRPWSLHAALATPRLQRAHLYREGARNAGSQWNLQGTLRLSGVHRWDLGESPLDPAINAALTADWRPGEPRVEVTRCVVEAPRSRLNASGSLDWSHGLDPVVQLVFFAHRAWRFAGVAARLSAGHCR